MDARCVYFTKIGFCRLVDVIWEQKQMAGGAGMLAKAGPVITL